MLTVDFDQLGLAPGHRFLDLGAGAGRHAAEALRRGATVTAVDLSFDEIATTRNLLAAMLDGDEAPSGASAAALNGDALHLPFADSSFDRIVCSEVLEHIQDDRGAMTELLRVLAPGGTLAVTVPAWLPERICWALSAEFHAPLAVGGHVRVYTHSELVSRLRDTGFDTIASHKAHGLHSPYWILKCVVGPTNDANPLVRAYHRMLVWDITKRPRATRLAESALDPFIGKSLVVYCQKPAAELQDTETGTAQEAKLHAVA